MFEKGEDCENQRIKRGSGLIQNGCGREMGVDLAAVSRWDSGESMPRAAKLPKLAELFHCSIDELFRDPETQKPPA